MYQTILFDLDGTLTDSKPGITKSVQYALAQMGIAVSDLAKLEHFIGPPVIDSFKEHYGFDDEQCAQALDHFRIYFVEKGMLDNSVFPGIPALLEKLKQEGRTLMVATAKPQPFAEQILDHFHLSDFFSDIQGMTLDEATAEKSVIVRLLMERMQDTPTHTIVMVGDRKHDIIAARENGLDSIGVQYGYAPEGEMEKARPTYVAESVEALEKLLLG